MNNKFFPSRYPIVAALMNQCSNLNFALAVADAGAFPSIGLTEQEYNVDKNKTAFNDRVDSILTEFIKCQGNSNLLVNVQVEQLLNDLQLMRCLHSHRISHIEVWKGTCGPDGVKVRSLDSILADPKINSAIKFLKSTAKILIRIYEPTDPNPLVDGFCIKGKESGGVTGNWPVNELFDYLNNQNISTALIPYGGISTPLQVQNYINAGATAVAVGTVLATCVESPLSTEVKNKMISASNVINIQGQNQIILGEVVADDLDKDNWNRTRSLNQSIHGNGDKGFIYAGHGIQQVDRIKTIKETVEYLTQYLT